METQSSEEFQGVEAPFDDPSADLTLQSSDGHHFHVYRIILAQASLQFKTTFSLPQPATEGATVPVLPLTEDAKSLDALLRIIYPTRSPKLPGEVRVIKNILEAGRKYEIELVLDACAESLLDLVEKLEEAVDSEHEDGAKDGQGNQFKTLAVTTLQVYAIACQYGLEDVANKVAHVTLSLPLPVLVSTHVPELDMLSASALQRLLDYRMECAKVASDFDSMENLQSEWTERYRPCLLYWDFDNQVYCRFCRWKTDNQSNPVSPEWLDRYFGWLSERIHEMPGRIVANSEEAILQANEFASRCTDGQCTLLRKLHFPAFADLVASTIEELLSDVSVSVLR